MKVWLLVGLLVLVVIVVAQNSDVVELRFLFWEVSLSRVVVLLLTLTIGIVVGFLGAKLPRGRSRGE